ncbi:MAG TPA: DUF3604 domain-containing protein, partial [Armatimonadetes bacterium]|nr:DUF3604 domain-containing protein [Armatimonadota bacterium]
MNSERNLWYGCAKVTPMEPVVAGNYGTWQLTYTAGKYGIDNSGAILICWRFAIDWGRPQTTDPSAENYLTASTDADARLDVAYVFKGHRRPWYHAVYVNVYDGEIRPGEHIVLTFGDTRFGSVGQRAPTAVNKRCEWHVFVDPFCTRRFVQLDDPPTVEIVSGEPSSITVVLPSDAVCGERMRIMLRVEDKWGNPASSYCGTVRTQWEPSDGAPEGMGQVIAFSESDGGVKIFDNITPQRAGIFRLRARDAESGLECISNPCVCHSKRPAFIHLWGDLHGQSEEALGIGSVHDYFRYARDVAGIDFASNQGNDFDISDAGWRRIQDAVRKFNEPQRFVTFLGYEWSGNTSGGGDHNVIFLRDDEPIRRSSHANVESGDTSMDCYPISELYRAFAGRDDVLLIPHIGGRFANLEFHEPSLEPLIEIYSCWGLFEWFLKDALLRGMRIGFVATSDDHKGRPGASHPGAHIFGVYGGLTCALAKEFTREAIFEALCARRCYATTGERILLHVTCNGHQMGEEFELTSAPTIQCCIVGTAGIESVDVLRFAQGDERPRVVYSHPINADVSASNCIKIAWTGLRRVARYFQIVWDGSLTLTDGRIASAREYAFDTPLEGIIERSERRVVWRSQTAGDEDGIIVEVDAPAHARLHFETQPISFDIAVGDISMTPIEFVGDGIDTRVTVRRLPAAPFPTELEFTRMDAKPPIGINAYFVRVVQQDSNRAYS